MKRDCGEGELIPCKWAVVSCFGMNDDEQESEHATMDLAKTVYEQQLILVKQQPCSDVRLYAYDKQGYANCILSCIHSANGEIHETDRRNEL